MYSLFHKTLPKSILQMHGIPERFYEMVDILPRLKDKNYSDMKFFYNTNEERFFFLKKYTPLKLFLFTLFQTFLHINVKVDVCLFIQKFTLTTRKSIKLSTRK